MKNDLIFSRRPDDQALTRSQIFSRAPAILADGHAEGLSRRYGEVSTLRALDILEGYGWAPVQAAQKKARKIGGHQYAAHLVSFADQKAGSVVAGDRPEIILYNSHDGSSSVRLFVGFYRFICSNGIVAGEGFEARLRHTSGSVQGFESMLSEVVSNIPAMVDRIARLKTRRLTPAEQFEIASRAAALRWDPLPSMARMGDYQGFEGSSVVDKFGPIDSNNSPVRGAFFNRTTIRDLLMVTRLEDQYSDAWTVLNRVQEGVIRSGARIQSITDRNAAVGGIIRRARAVGSVAESVRINRGLWDAVAEVAGIDPTPAVEAAGDLIAA